MGLGWGEGGPGLGNPTPLQPGGPHWLWGTYWGIKCNFTLEKGFHWNPGPDGPRATCLVSAFPTKPLGPCPAPGGSQPPPNMEQGWLAVQVGWAGASSPGRAGFLEVAAWDPARAALTLSPELHGAGQNPGFSSETRPHGRLFGRYKDYREPPWSEHKYDISKDFWAVLAARLAFVIVFQVRRACLCRAREPRSWGGTLGPEQAQEGRSRPASGVRGHGDPRRDPQGGGPGPVQRQVPGDPQEYREGRGGRASTGGSVWTDLERRQVQLSVSGLIEGDTKEGRPPHLGLSLSLCSRCPPAPMDRASTDRRAVSSRGPAPPGPDSGEGSGLMLKPG